MQRDKSKIEAAPFKLSWPAIFGGMFAAAGVWLLLHVLGLAIGLTQLDPGDPNDLRATGIGGGIWTVVASMVSLFAGGMVTARAAGLLGRSNAGLHGIVLWGATTVGGLVLIVSVMASLARGVSGMSIERMTITTGPAQATAPGAEPADTTAQPAAPEDQGQITRAEQATTVSARAFWAAFSVMLLSLLSSVLGAIAGVTRRQRELSAQVAELPPISPVARPVGV